MNENLEDEITCMCPLFFRVFVSNFLFFYVTCEWTVSSILNLIMVTVSISYLTQKHEKS